MNRLEFIIIVDCVGNSAHFDTDIIWIGDLLAVVAELTEPEIAQQLP
jgi:hypothetical protein